MSLSKQQIAGFVGVGVFVVLAGGLGYMLWDAVSQRQGAEANLAEGQDSFRRYNEADVFPSQKSIAAVQSNKASYAAWQETASAFAARGDRSLPGETPPIFKQRLQSEVRRLAQLPGGVDGKISASTFLFGFDQYLGEGGVLPAEADVPRLAAQLDLITHVVELFAEAGVHDVRAIQRIEAAKKDAGADDDKPAKAKRKAKAKAKDAEEEDAPKTTCLEYAIEFSTRPAAFVSVLNALTADERFIVVKGFSFKETSDLILERIAAAEAAEAAKNSPNVGRRGRRRGGDAKPEEAKKVDRLVVDPESDAPIQVNMTLAVYDFGRAVAAKPAADAPAEDAAKDDAGRKPAFGEKPAAKGDGEKKQAAAEKPAAKKEEK